MVIAIATYRGPDWTTVLWIVGWLVCAIAVGCAYAYEAGRIGSSRAWAVFGGVVRGSVTGMIWPIALLYFVAVIVLRSKSTSSD